MEKRKPHCPLPVVQALAKEGKIRTTYAAAFAASALGFEKQDIIDYSNFSVTWMNGVCHVNLHLDGGGGSVRYAV